jgi:plasmid stabilization system protein ParE
VNWRLTIRPAAKTDLREAAEWYDSKRPKLGDRFLLAAADALDRIEESPLQFPLYYNDFRRAITDGFPYKIFFSVEGETVTVFRALHAARDHTRLLRWQ